MSRQNFYRVRVIRARKKVDEGLVKELVQAERKVQPRIGGLKLYRTLRSTLEEAGVGMGRDRFFEVLKNQGLLLKPLRRAPRTTNSRHNLPVFTNLIKDMEVTYANEVWVCDITYIRTDEDFVYLSLVTDKRSRKIVGYHLSRTLEAEESLKALEVALAELPAGAFPVHHSDRGSQYCSHAYVQCLQDHEMGISMTEENHCAENALAERVNGILKQEYFLGHEFKSFQHAHEAVREAIHLYNTRRLHRSLEFRTPDEVHRAAS
jgi:transposase InsO family protein